MIDFKTLPLNYHLYVLKHVVRVKLIVLGQGRLGFLCFCWLSLSFGGLVSSDATFFNVVVILHFA